MAPLPFTASLDDADTFRIEPSSTGRVNLTVRDSRNGGLTGLHVITDADKLAELRDAIDAFLSAPKAEAA